MADRPVKPNASLTRRRFLRHAAAATGGAAAAGLLGAAADEPAGVRHALAAAPVSEKRGGTLTVSLSADLNTLNPWTGTTLVWRVVKTDVFDQLSYQDPATFQFKPKLAKSFEWTDKNTSLLVTLPAGVQFHNGEGLTAEDVKFTLDSIRDPKTGSYLRGLIAPILDTQVLDATHLKIKTAGVENQLIPAFTYIDIVPRSQGADLTRKQPIGSGPYKFTEWVPNDHIRLDRNPVYWNHPQAGHVDTILFRPVTESQTRISQVLAGDVDLMYDMTLVDVPRLQADRRVVVVIVPPVEQMFVMYLNMRRPPFNKVEMRQAMAWALDRDAFIKNFLYGQGRPDNSPFTPKHWAFDPKTEGAYSYNPDRVGQLMEKAGYPKGQGLNFSFIVPSGFPEFKALSTLLQATFASLGYQPAIEEVDIAQWVARTTQSHDYFGAVDYPPRGTADPAFTYAAGNIFPPTPANVTGLTTTTIPGYVDALRTGATTLNQNLRKTAYTRVQELWLEYLPGPIFCHRSIAHAALPYVKGFVPHQAFQQHFASVWLDK